MRGRIVRRVAGLGAALLFWGAVPGEASGTAGCRQAAAILETVRGLYAAGDPDHALLLGKLATARRLCPSLGEAWKLSACSAAAAGDEARARFFRDQALFNGVADLGCPTAGDAHPEAPPSLPSWVGDKYALVIGIGRFADPAIPVLRYAAKDARDLAGVLGDPRHGRFPPDHVTVLTDAQATRGNILEALNQLMLRAREEDLVFLYVSTHGSPRRPGSGLGGVGYIVTHDTSLEEIWVDALDYQDFSRKVSMIPARRKAVFLDTCYSGQATPGQKALLVEQSGVDPSTAKLFLSGSGTYVVTSSRADERSFESERLQNSYFTHFLMAALRHQEGASTIQEIFGLLEREVPATVARDLGQSQTPQMLPREGEGDLRIGVQPRRRSPGRDP